MLVKILKRTIIIVCLFQMILIPSKNVYAMEKSVEGNSENVIKYITITEKDEYVYENEDMYINSIGMYESDVIELYNQYLEQVPETLTIDKDTIQVLEGFAQYAIEQGVIENTAEQKGAITKAVVRAEFKLVVEGGELLGYTAAATLLNHSLQDSPSNLSYNTLTNMAKQISESNECQTIISNFKNAVLGTNLTKKTMTGSIALCSTTDLHLAYNNVNYTVNGVNTNGKWTLSIVFTDTYDFDAVSWKNALTDNALVTILNNYAAYAESIGAIVPYNVQVTVPAVF